MTKEEFINEKKKLESEYESNLNALEMKYCLQKCKYQPGDIVEDNICVVRLGNKCFPYHSMNTDDICLVFTDCTELVKSTLLPKKSNAVRNVYECNIKKIITKKNE